VSVGRYAIIFISLLLTSLAELTIGGQHGALCEEGVVEANALAPVITDDTTEWEWDRWDIANVLVSLLNLLFLSSSLWLDTTFYGSVFEFQTTKGFIVVKLILVSKEFDSTRSEADYRGGKLLIKNLRHFDLSVESVSGHVC